MPLDYEAKLKTPTKSADDDEEVEVDERSPQQGRGHRRLLGVVHAQRVTSSGQVARSVRHRRRLVSGHSGNAQHSLFQ